ncbi:ABC transporter ATP-binding protein [Paracoccus sp. Z330]|uniref:ABC transporter ATP-binding protein n=1 Tax=Paracoccus onchidii TaxID=3017813 RepID=A0ABT4ZAA6_9RHOB|nr:ABC transporter ATP-binding protein [Paracoccus onchidii]MDB6176279.1 ABC transporter ATP-binding protein [Paracoccus onchidii]
MIELQSLTKIYDGVTVVDDVSLTINSGEIATIVGTSGSGKTTLLRMINRLVQPSSGRILIDGEETSSIPAYELRRRIGYAIQGHGLFPHRSVGRNIGTVPRLLGWKQARIAARVDELLDLFGLEPGEFRDRMPHELSGGQQQRVGVARALAAGPNILLMDEPFGALDPIIRAKAQDDLLAIQRRIGTTIVLVTHDMNEAISLGHNIAVMDQGRLLQFAPPADIIARPGTPFVEALIGSEDRPFRMLALQRVRDLIEKGPASGPAIDAWANARAAYAELLWSGREAAPVQEGGAPVGRITRAALQSQAEKPV